MVVKKLAAIVAVVLVALPAWAMPRNHTKAQLEKFSTAIVRGAVTRVYEVTEKDEHTTNRHFVAEVLVAEVDKGEGVAKGQSIFIRGSTIVAEEKGYVGGSGDWCQEKGQAVRVYLKKDAAGLWTPAAFDAFQRLDYAPPND